MNRTVKFLDWFVSNALVWALGILGTFCKLTWAYHVTVFLMSFFGLYWLVLWLGAEGIRSNQKLVRLLAVYPVPRAVAALFDIGLACVMVAFGHWVFAIFIILQMTFEQSARERLKGMVVRTPS